MRTLLVSRAAKTDLVDIWDYTATTWSPAQADRYLDQLDSALQACRLKPERGRPRDELLAGYRSVLIGRHLAFYTFDTTQMTVQRVLHASMDLRRHLLSDD